MKELKSQNPTIPSFKEDKSDVVGILIQLHIAEYNSLTTRCTNFTYIINAVLSLIVVWLTAMIGLWISKPQLNIIPWGALLGSQIFGIIFATLVYEQYNMVRYIEGYLRPEIEKLVNNKIFWYYESFLISQRKDTYKIWEFSSAIATAIFIIALAIVRAPREWIDFLGLGINLVLLVVLSSKLYDGAKIRWNKWKMD
jgi:hypothetical protein